MITHYGYSDDDYRQCRFHANRQRSPYLASPIAPARPADQRRACSAYEAIGDKGNAAAREGCMSIVQSFDLTAGDLETSPRPSALTTRPLYPLMFAGTGSYVPPALLTSDRIDRMADRPAGWAKDATGIESRHVVGTESVIDLAVIAAERAITAAGIARTEIDCIIATGALAHQPIPTSAILIQRALGLGTSGVPAFDVNATCLGFVAALDLAGALLAAGRYDTILLTAADIPSKGTNWRNPELKAMFGDGSAAAILRRSHRPGQGVLGLALESYGEGAAACTLRAGGTGLDPHADIDRFLDGTWFEMDGPLAYRISSRHMPEFFGRLLKSAGVTVQDIDLVIPHQASAHALYLMRRRLGIPAAKLVDQLATRGNQVSASIPSMLDHALSNGLARSGDIVLLIGTAAGITLGGAVVRL